MTVNPQSLLARLDEIGQSLARKEHALALIGLGSVGLELDRIDEYSDLDFFVIVEEESKAAFLGSLHWLSDIHPIAYCFLNTVDGYKLLFDDGIFCEFAVFEPGELTQIPFAPGRIVWKRNELPNTFAQPAAPPATPSPRSKEWLLGEVLTNIYVGLQRDKRGETLSATRFIQGYAVDRLLELVEFIDEGQSVHRDPFVNERRFEQRHPDWVSSLRLWVQGYEKNGESARAMLEFLEKHFEVNVRMAGEIRRIIRDGE